MKKLITITIIALITALNANAQVYSISYSERVSSNNEYREQIREVQNFENKLDRFSYALVTNDLWEAQRTKTKILRAMEAEIARTKKELRKLRNNRNLGRSYTYGSKSVYSKRNGRGIIFSELVDQLEYQKTLRYRFKNTDLKNSRRGIKNENTHRRLMYEFRDTMIEGQSSSHTRKRNYQRARRG